MSRLASKMLIVGLLTALPACKEKDKATTTPDWSDAQQAAAKVILAKADAYDGTTDMTVSKCSTCALRMDGSAANESQLAGYTLHFCSDRCKQTFDEDAHERVLAMTVPDAGDQ